MPPWSPSAPVGKAELTAKTLSNIIEGIRTKWREDTDLGVEVSDREESQEENVEREVEAKDDKNDILDEAELAAATGGTSLSFGATREVVLHYFAEDGDTAVCGRRSLGACTLLGCEHPGFGAVQAPLVSHSGLHERIHCLFWLALVGFLTSGGMVAKKTTTLYSFEHETEVG